MKRRVYLSGGIEHSGDGGRGWRKEIRLFLEQLGDEVYDPAADEKKDLTEEERLCFRRWKTDSPERFRAVVRKIIAWDLARIESGSDYVLAFWDDSASRGGGATMLCKPMLSGSRPACSAWRWIVSIARRASAASLIRLASQPSPS